MMNLEGFERKLLWPDRGTVLVFAWMAREEQRTSFMISADPAEIRIEYLPNTNLDCYCYVIILGEEVVYCRMTLN
jgi:hypothetical protein